MLAFSFFDGANSDHTIPASRLYEMQAFLFVLVSRFQFSLTEDISRLRREYAGSLVPTLEGEVEKGAQLPLGVSLAEQHQD